MIIDLLGEAVLASLLAPLLGYILGHSIDRVKKGTVEVFLSVFVSIVVLMSGGWLFCRAGHLCGDINAGLKGDLEIIYTLFEIAIWAVLLGSGLGYLLNGCMSAFFFDGFILGFVFAALWYAMALRSFESPYPHLLLLAIFLFLLGLFFACLLAITLQPKRWLTLWGMWTAFYLTFAAAYKLAGRWGIYLIAWPSLLAFDAALSFFSQKVLPVRSQEQRRNAFKSLFTYALGTNYPYYVIADYHGQKNGGQARPAPRVVGNSFKKLFAGPGIILNNSNHLALIEDDCDYRIIHAGLGFTYFSERLLASVDLSPQFRVKTVEAMTKDGVVMDVPVSLCYRLEPGDRALTLGGSYPVNENVLKLIVCNLSSEEHTHEKHTYEAYPWACERRSWVTQEAKNLSWDETVFMMALPCVKRVLSKYNCDALYGCGGRTISLIGRFQPATTTQQAIAREFREALVAQMALVGVDLVAGTLGPFSAPKLRTQQRVRDWKITWQENSKVALEETDTEFSQTLDSVWLEAQYDVLRRLLDMLNSVDSVPLDALSFSLLDCLGAIPKPGTDNRGVFFQDFFGTAS